MNDQPVEHTSAVIAERIRGALNPTPLLEIQKQPVTEAMWFSIVRLAVIQLRKAADDIEATL